MHAVIETTNSTVKIEIRVNGQEYASLDEMPDDVRQDYERALAQTTSGTGDYTRAWLFLAAVVMALWLLASFELGR